MKIRNGFVSNSSTSSFVIIGVRLSHSEIKELEKKLKVEYIWDYCNEQDWLYDAESDTPVIGYCIADVHDDDEFQEKEIDLDELKKKIKEVEKVTGKKAKLITGTRMC